MAKLTLKQVAANLMATAPMDVSHRNIRDVQCASTPVTLSIGQIFALVDDKKLKRNIMQRNDELRREMGRAKHVTKELHMAHLDIVVAFWKNSYHLVDGCHRIGHWFETEAEIPSHVTVLLKMPKTEAEYISLYRAIDSNKSTKSKRDFLYGYLRLLKVESKIKSNLMKAGAWVTAFNNLTKGGGVEAEMATMRTYLQAVLKVDGHRLKVEEIPQGFILAALRLYHSHTEKAPVEQYVNELILAYTRGVMTCSNPVQAVMVDFATVRQDYGDKIGGEEVTRQIAEVVEVGFDRFCKLRSGQNAKAFQKELVIAPMARAKLA
jgi:hypothetical protein